LVPPFFSPDDSPSLDSALHSSDPQALRACACLAGALFPCPVPFDDGNGMLVHWCGFATDLPPLRDRRTFAEWLRKRR
jgi:hypothetical protein